jgi:hypothetical protein
MSSIESPVEKATMLLSKVSRDGIVQNDQGYLFPKEPGPAHPAVKVRRFKMSSVESPVEKAIMPPSGTLRDRIVQNDQGYPFPKNPGHNSDSNIRLKMTVG